MWRGCRADRFALTRHVAVTRKATPGVEGVGLVRAEQEARDPPELHLHCFTFPTCIVIIDGTKGVGGGSQSVSGPPGSSAPSPQGADLISTSDLSGQLTGFKPVAGAEWWFLGKAPPPTSGSTRVCSL